ncbi:hypothetical protein CJF42_05850 [Pseudoalteromonas sp. NBT06-2]|nr:hypothetical protein CJF42_05850 [Pseudoalteromonas sp. NBT06-2]
MNPNVVKYSIVIVISMFFGAFFTYINVMPQNVATNIDPKNNSNTAISANLIANKENSVNISFNELDVPPSKFDNFKQIVQIGTGFEQGLAAYHLASDMQFAELSVNLTALFKLEKQDPAVKLSYIVRQRMLLLDPLATAQLYYSHFKLYQENLDKRTISAFRGILHDWALLDIKNALSFVKDNFPIKQQEYYFDYLLKDNHFKQSGYLFAQANQFSPAIQQKALRAKLDSMKPELAFEKLLALTLPPRERYYMFRSVIKKWQSASLDNYLSLQNKLITSNLANREKEKLINEVFIQWADSDPESALSAISQIKYGKQSTYITSIMSELAKKDGEHAVLVAKTFSKQLGNEIIDTAISEWATYDPQAATQYIEKNGLTKNQSLLYKVAQTYGRKSPKEALQWAENLNAPEAVFRNISRSLINSSPEAAQNYLDSVTNQKVKNAMLSAMVNEKSRYNSEEAHIWLNQYSAEPGFKEAQQTVFYSWIRQNPQQAVHALSEVTDNKQLHNLIPTMAYQWYKKDPTATENWLRQLNNTAIKDLAILRIVMYALSNDIGHAKTLISEINDEKIAEKAKKRLNHYEETHGN